MLVGCCCRLVGFCYRLVGLCLQRCRGWCQDCWFLQICCRFRWELPIYWTPRLSKHCSESKQKVISQIVCMLSQKCIFAINLCHLFSCLLIFVRNFGHQDVRSQVVVFIFQTCYSYYAILLVAFRYYYVEIIYIYIYIHIYTCVCTCLCNTYVLCF